MLLSHHPEYVMYHTVWPNGVDKCIVNCSWLFLEENANNHKNSIYEAIDFWDKTNKQDWEICEYSQLGINSKKKEIQKYYQLISEKNLNLITPFKKTQKIIGLLNKYQIKKAICTSKDFQRTKKILNKYNLKFDAIEADINNQKKGKPHPDKILSILDKLKIDKKYSVYIGDMYIDYLTAKNAKIDYLHAGWGYSKINQNVTILNSIDEVLDYVEMK